MAATATAYTPVTNAGANAPACGYQCAPRGLCTPRGGKQSSLGVTRRKIDPARLNLLNNLLFRVIRPALLFQLRQT